MVLTSVLTNALFTGDGKEGKAMNGFVDTVVPVFYLI